MNKHKNLRKEINNRGKRQADAIEKYIETKNKYGLPDFKSYISKNK
jgi:hypothetical protein